MGARVLQPELMDDPDLPALEHRHALDGLSRLNRLSRSAAALWPIIEARAHAVHGVPISVLDVATGSADGPVAWARRARTVGIALDLRVCDASSVALEAATARARAAGVELAASCRDVVGSGLEGPDGSVDIVTCSLFLHHLREDQVVRVLSEMQRVARRCVVVSDLRRCWMGLVAAAVASRVMTRSRVVHGDAVRSVRAAFTERELRELADRAGMSGARIRRVWPFRMLLVWERP